MDREKALQALDAYVKRNALSINLKPEQDKEIVEAFYAAVPVLRAALTAPDAVDVEALKKSAIAFAIKTQVSDYNQHTVQNILHGFINHIIENGLLPTADDELKRVTQALEQCLSFLIKHNMVNRDDEGILTLRYPSHSDDGLGTAEQAIDFALKNIDDAWTDRCAFLEAWQHGDLSEWPEYKSMIAEVKK